MLMVNVGEELNVPLYRWAANRKGWVRNKKTGKYRV